MRISIEFDIVVNDFGGLRKEIAEYSHRDIEYITNDDIHEYFEDHIKPAKSKSKSFEIIGGDTDGWFVNEIECINDVRNDLKEV